MFGVIILCAFAGQLAAGQDEDPNAWRARVQTTLQNDAQLQQLHRGYRRFLQSDSDAARAERDMAALLQRPTLRRLYSNFEEQLAGDPELDRAFDTYNQRLATNDNLRGAVDTLAEFAIQHRSADMAQALQWLRANPAEALQSLTRPSGVLPRALRPIERVVQGDESAFTALTDALEEIAADAPATAFWSRLAENPGAAADAAALEDHLLRFPEAYRAWRRQSTTAAEEPRVQNWNRYWRRLTQRYPDLARWYSAYLNDELDEPAAKPDQDLAKGSEWPPRGDPPRLTRLETIARPSVARPEAPGVARPLRPARPQANRPARPAAPMAPGLESRL